MVLVILVLDTICKLSNIVAALETYLYVYNYDLYIMSE